MRCLRIAFGLAAALGLAVPVARAQDQNADVPPAHLSIVEGTAALDREAASEEAGPGMPLVPGDRVRTSQGRVEILFPDGSAIDLDEYSTIEMQSATLLRLTEGRLILVVAGVGNPSGAERFQVDTPAASVTAGGPGEYRVSILSGPSGLQTELSVVRGTGALTTERGSMSLGAGEQSLAWADGLPSYPRGFNSARLDAFAEWASGLREQRRGSASARYLPSDLRMYGGALDQYGAWEYQTPHGYVWYPTVATDWRPYYDGYWASVPRYGWTWIGLNIWSWPTHHYGRWGYGRNRWYWIPERHWSAAWVSWGSAPGYVSWSPLGYDNRPVFGFSISARNSWTGWTVLPRDRFGIRDRDLRRYAIGPRSLPATTPFVAHAVAPVVPPRAMYRGGAPQGAHSTGSAVPRRPYSSSGVAVPRGSYSSGRPGAIERSATQPARPGDTPKPSRYPRTAERRYMPSNAAPPERAVGRARLPETIRGESIPPETYSRSGAGRSTDRRNAPGGAISPEPTPVPNRSDPAIYRGRYATPGPRYSTPGQTVRPPDDQPRYGYGVGTGRRSQAAPAIATPERAEPTPRQERYQRAAPRNEGRDGGAPGNRAAGRDGGRDSGRSAAPSNSGGEGRRGGRGR